MTVEFRLVDGLDSKRAVQVLETRALRVAASTPPLLGVGVPSEFRFFSALFGSEGQDTGVTNLNVDGSVTPLEFFINSEEGADIRIKKLMIYIQDNQVRHDGIGNLGALANGIDITVREQGVNTPAVMAAMTFADLIQQTFAERPWGGDLTAFELTNVSGTDDAQVLPFDIGSLIPEGIRIGRASKDRITVTIRDDLSTLTAFTVRAAGFRQFPPTKVS